MTKRMRYKRNKYIGLVLFIIMILSFLPVHAFAAASHIVAFDPNDGKTTYPDFYKVTVSDGDKISDVPSDPNREGYFFKGWYYALDENDKPILWDFGKDTVSGNTTLWATWEKGCIVAFDPDDGVYNDFYKITVPIDGRVTNQPKTPKREGYIFKGWYAVEDENGKPILWNFGKDTVNENTTLWAAWEKGCIVAFDPDDGVAQYRDFYKSTVSIGGKVTDKPTDPKREGYVFKGWYHTLDENDKPIFWNFKTGTVEDNITLWAAWEKGQEGTEQTSNPTQLSANEGTDSTNSSASHNGSQTGDASEPQTGDDSLGSGIFWALASLSVATLVTLMILHKRKRKS